MNRLTTQVNTIYQTLGDTRIEDSGLLTLGEGSIASPIAPDMLSLYSHRSARPDGGVAWPAVQQLLAAIRETDGYKGINHIGFCYQVDDREAEVARIRAAAHAAGVSAFREPSVDAAAWLFIGDISRDISAPLIELLPVAGPQDDQWVDYWLPHIQFDIDTSLNPSQIKDLVTQHVDKPSTPFPIIIDGVTYIQRVNLGCYDGINIMLDIATNHRDIAYRKTWQQLA